MGPLRVDLQPRTVFYAQHGLVPRMPSAAPLEEVARRNVIAADPIERIHHDARHPQEILPGGSPSSGTTPRSMRGARAGRDSHGGEQSPSREARGLGRR